jgi:hypothetical protein
MIREKPSGLMSPAKKWYTAWVVIGNLRDPSGKREGSGSTTVSPITF